jgi:hypothetical protein
MARLLQDANGNTSSKRISGFIGITIAAAMSVYSVIQDPSQATTIVWSWLSFAGVMFGVGVLEKKREQ